MTLLITFFARNIYTYYHKLCKKHTLRLFRGKTSYHLISESGSFFSLSKSALFKSFGCFTNQVKNMSLKIKVFIVIISIFVKLSFGLWPYSSQGQSDICFIENKLEIVCDCTEPNVICRGLNLTDINYILPDGTELVNFARFYISG